MDLGIKNIIGLRDNALNYAKNLRINDTDFRFTKNSEVSPYARCFAIFIYKLLNKKELLSNKLMLSRAIKKDLNDLKKATKNNFLYNKPYMQLLTFSLSAKYILGTI